jgi:hypothetical protein
MACVTYFIRVLPLTFIRKKIDKPIYKILFILRSVRYIGRHGFPCHFRCYGNSLVSFNRLYRSYITFLLSVVTYFKFPSIRLSFRIYCRIIYLLSFQQKKTFVKQKLLQRSFVTIIIRLLRQLPILFRYLVQVILTNLCGSCFMTGNVL